MFDCESPPGAGAGGLVHTLYNAAKLNSVIDNSEQCYIENRSAKKCVNVPMDRAFSVETISQFVSAAKGN